MIREIEAWWKRVEDLVHRIQPRQARRIIVAVIGFTVLSLGVVMLVLPGPALVVIPAGLAILGLEFAWAKRWLHKVKTLASAAAARAAAATSRPKTPPHEHVRPPRQEIPS
jgi:uncharacterized protein (TIGR02611 family)